MFRTTRDLPLVAWANVVPGGGDRFILPAGSPAMLVRQLDGRGWDGFVIADVAQLTRLTGNSHDSRYRYVILPADAIDGDDDASRAEAARITREEAERVAARQPR